MPWMLDAYLVSHSSRGSFHPSIVDVHHRYSLRRQSTIDLSSFAFTRYSGVRPRYDIQRFDMRS